MDRPPACKCTWVEDGKQEIYLEWPYVGAAIIRGIIGARLPREGKLLGVASEYC